MICFYKLNIRRIEILAALVLLIVLIFCLNTKAFTPAPASTYSIKDAKIDKDSNFVPDLIGKYVTVSGRVTVPSDLLDPEKFQIFIQDSSGGISIFSSGYYGKPIKLGDSVSVTGKLEQYYGLTEIDTPKIKIINHAGSFVPKPLIINNYHNLEAYEGMLVNIDARIVDKSSNRSGKYYIVVPSYGSDITLNVFISDRQKDRKQFEDFEIGETVNLTGIIEQHDFNSKPDSFYQIIPRFSGDMKVIRHNVTYYLKIILFFVALVLIISLLAVYFKFEVNKRTRNLLESEKRFSNLADINLSAIIIYTEEKIVYVNKTLSKLTGYTSEELLNKKITDFIHPDFRYLIKQIRPVKSKDEQVAERNEIKIVNKNGTEIWLDFTAGFITWKGVEATIGTAFDVTERKLAEEELRKYSRAVEQSPASVVITNTKGEIEFVNHKFCNITGYSKKEVIGKNLRILKSGFYGREYYKNLWNTILGGRDWKDEILNKKKSGELYWENEIISSIINHEGKITHFIAVKEDITEKKKMVEDLVKAKILAEQSNKLKDTFMANISHEIRTPLNGILGMISLLKDSFSNYIGNDEDEYFSSIERSSRRIIRTIDMILNYSSLHAGSFPVNTIEVELSVICDNLVEEFRLSASKKNLRLSFNNLCGEFVFINADDFSIVQAISNLMDNAIKYTKEGFIEINLYKNEYNSVLLDIKDSGIGIDEKNLDFIFEPYTQEDMGYSRAYEGVGLGLALVKEFLELNNAAISVKSMKEKGTTFTINFGLCKSIAKAV